MPDDGVAKPPDTPDNPRVGARMKAAGAAAGIDFTGKTDRAPNSVRAHAVLDYALEQHGAAAQNALMEVLFRHYFTDGRYPDDANLADAVREAIPSGGDAAARAAIAHADARAGAVRRAAAAHSERGISGVPYFFVGGEPLFSGARPASDFVDILSRRIADEDRTAAANGAGGAPDAVSGA